MNISREKLLDKLSVILKRYFIPLLLGATVMYNIFYAYMNSGYWLMTAAFAAYESFLFWFFEKLKPKKVLRGLVYFLVGLLHLFGASWLMILGYRSTGVLFSDWFYVDQAEVGEVPLYMAFLFLGLGFFLVSVLYYFTVYRYRIFGVMLVTLFPFVIYGKRSINISTLSVTIMMTVFLTMMVHQRLVSDENSKTDKKKLMIDPSYVLGAALFVTFAGAVTMVLPKPAYQSELEKGTGIFRYDFTSNRTSYDDLSEESSPRFGADSTGEILFYAASSANEPVIYIRRQSFDIFDYDKNTWVLDDEYGKYFDLDNDGDNEVNSPLYVYSTLKELAQSGKYKGFGLSEEIFDKYGEYQNTSRLRLSSDTYRPTYIPAPLMINTAPFDYMIKTYHGEIYTRGYSDYYGALSLSYNYTTEGSAEAQYLSELPFDSEDYRHILYEAWKNGDLRVGAYRNYMKIQESYTDAIGSSDRMKELAHSITDEYDSEYEKAQALVDYFVKEGYVYDNDYEPDDESIDYFLFDSKTGNCTSYATSMTLMARLVGLPARYVEGFSAYERDDNGRYVIRDSHAHAFVEVYIAGAGWVTFDPTVPGYMDISNGGNNGGANTQLIATFIDYLSRIILFLGVVFVLVFIVFFDRIAELIFRISLKFKKSDKQRITAVYRRILRLLELSLRKQVKGMTPGEIRELAATVGADADMPISLFERVCFGGYEPDRSEYLDAYEVYKQAWKALAGKDKKQKKAKAQNNFA